MNELPKSPDLQNIFQLILNEADQLFLLSDKTALNLNKKKIRTPEMMKLFYRSIHKKMHMKRINFKKKNKITFF